jgi:hypothetical protein
MAVMTCNARRADSDLPTKAAPRIKPARPDRATVERAGSVCCRRQHRLLPTAAYLYNRPRITSFFRYGTVRRLKGLPSNRRPDPCRASSRAGPSDARRDELAKRPAKRGQLRCDMPAFAPPAKPRAPRQNYSGPTPPSSSAVSSIGRGRTCDTSPSVFGRNTNLCPITFTSSSA